MGQQQLLLIILGIIIVGIAIAVGISQFGAQSTESNKDAMTSNLVSLAANAYQFKIRPSTLGGGSGSYTNYQIPAKMQNDDDGSYSVGAVTATTVTLVGTSKLNALWSTTCVGDDTGKTTVSYSGW